jgi:hypothetical protein
MIGCGRGITVIAVLLFSWAVQLCDMIFINYVKCMLFSSSLVWSCSTTYEIFCYHMHSLNVTIEHAGSEPDVTTGIADITWELPIQTAMRDTTCMLQRDAGFQYRSPVFLLVYSGCSCMCHVLEENK